MGTVRDRPGLSPPCQQAWGLLPRGSPRTLRARLSDTKNKKPSRTSERPQRRAEAVRGHRDRQDQSRKRAAHTRRDNDLMSAPRPAPRSSPGIRTDPRPSAIGSPATPSGTIARTAATPGKPPVYGPHDPRNRRQRSTPEDDVQTPVKPSTVNVSAALASMYRSRFSSVTSRAAAHTARPRLTAMPDDIP